MEFDDIFGFKKVTISENPLIFQISGLSGHSAMVVKKITHRKTGTTLAIDIVVVLAREGMFGSFEHKIIVEPDINKIVIGTENYEIWSRK
ncbi:MAG: hypothetical protein ACQ9MH_12605 [Nitrospinales bacterium]